MKRFIALVLSLIMTLSLCAPAWAKEAEPVVVAKVGVATYTDLQEAVDDGGEVDLLTDVTITKPLNITKNTVINGNNKTLTYTGDNRAIDVAKGTNGANLTINALTLAFTGGYRERGINYNTNGTLTLNNVTISGSTGGPTYAVSLPGSSDNATVNITNCDITGLIALNVWGENMKITVTDTSLTSVDGNATENYAAVKLNNDGETSAEGTVIDIIRGTITATDEEEKLSEALYNATKTGKINVSDPPTNIEGDSMIPVAVIRYPESNNSYSFYSLEDAAAKATVSDTITLINNTTLTEDVTLPCVLVVPAGVTLTGDKTKTISVAAGAKLGTDSNIIELFGTVDGVKFAVPNLGTFNAVRMNTGSALENSIFTGPYVGEGGNTTRGFVTVPGATGITISGNTFTNVRQPGYINDNTVATISNNTVDGTRGFCVAGADDVTFTGNTFKNTADWDKGVCDICYFASTKQLTDAEYYAISKANNNCLVEKQSGSEPNITKVTYQWAGAASIGNVNYDTLQAAVDAAEDGDTIMVKVDTTESVTVSKGITIDTKGLNATITAGKGYKLTKDGNTYTIEKLYTVTFDANGGKNEYTLEPMVAGKLVLPANPFVAPEGKQFKTWSVDGVEYAAGKEIDVAADVTVVAVWEYLPAVTNDPEVDVIAPVVSTNKDVDTSNATVNNVVTTITTGVDIDHGAITDAAEDAAEENKVVPTKEQAKELNKLSGISGTTVNDVAIVVQTYYDVAIEEVKVENNKTSSITVDITPMQQTVATTDDVIENKDDIKVGTNAVKVGDPVPVKITEPVEITLKLPSSCFTVGQKVYITHEASVGTVIYEAVVAADYTITFKTTHGFSPFTISATPAVVKASVGSDNYADLQSAVNYMGKDATVTVKAKDQSAVVDFATTFTVKYEGDATKDNTKITAAPGYYLTTKDVTGGVQYTVSRAYGWGGYVGGSSTSTPDKVVTSADTFDAGIGMYVAMSIMAAAGSAVVIGKKRED